MNNLNERTGFREREKKKMRQKQRLVTVAILLATFLVGIPALTPRAHAAATPCVTTLPCGIKILSPGSGGILNNNQTVQKSFLVSFLAQNITLVEPTLTTAVNTTTGTGAGARNEGHIHVFVDGAYTTIWTSSNGIPLTLSPGTHTIKLDLVNDLHQEFNPAISASTTVKVVDPLASITSTANSAQSNASNAQLYSLAALVVSIIVLVLVAYVAFKPKPKTP